MPDVFWNEKTGRLSGFPFLSLIRRTMEKEDTQQVQTMELPSVKKIVDCPKCKAKIEVEFEISMDMIMPELAKASLPIAPPEEKDK